MLGCYTNVVNVNFKTLGLTAMSFPSHCFINFQYHTNRPSQVESVRWMQNHTQRKSQPSLQVQRKIHRGEFILVELDLPSIPG